MSDFKPFYGDPISIRDDSLQLSIEAQRRAHAELRATHVVHYEDGDFLNGSIVLGPKIAPTAEELRFETDQGL